MLKVIESPNNDYSWLLDKENIKEDYIKLYLENYIYITLGLISNYEWYENSSDILCNDYDLEDVSEYSRVEKILDSEYKLIKDDDSTDVYLSKVYMSIDSDIKHTITLIGDLESYKYIMRLSLGSNKIDSILSDLELINLYEEDNDILMKLLSSKKGE